MVCPRPFRCRPAGLRNTCGGVIRLEASTFWRSPPVLPIHSSWEVLAPSALTGCRYMLSFLFLLCVFLWGSYWSPTRAVRRLSKGGTFLGNRQNKSYQEWEPWALPIPSLPPIPFLGFVWAFKRHWAWVGRSRDWPSGFKYSPQETVLLPLLGGYRSVHFTLSANVCLLCLVD